MSRWEHMDLNTQINKTQVKIIRAGPIITVEGKTKTGIVKQDVTHKDTLFKIKLRINQKLQTLPQEMAHVNTRS